MVSEQILFGLAFFAVFAFLAFRRPFLVLSGLLIGLLVHEWVLRWLTNSAGLPSSVVSGISLWKDAAIAALALAALVTWLREEPRSPITKNLQLADGLLALFAVMAGLSTIFSPNRLAGLAAFRDYFEPLLIFLLVRQFLPTQEKLSRILGLWLGFGAIIAALGIWQAVAWSAEDYRAWGYGEPASEVGIPVAGVRGADYLRPPSTVTGPNELGLHMVLLGLFSIQSIEFARGRVRWLFAAVALLFGVCLLLTVSRSALLGFLTGLAVLVGVKLKDRDRSRMPNLGRIRLILPLAIVSLLAIAMVPTGILDLLIDTLRGLSQEYHIRDTLDAIGFLSHNPQGVGMGLVGPRQGTFFPAVPAYHVEGSLFQIAMDMGVWGSVVWLLFLAAVLTRVWSTWRGAASPLLRTVGGTAFLGSLGALVVFVFLPLMQSLTIMSWLWFFLGLAYSGDRVELSWQSK